MSIWVVVHHCDLARLRSVSRQMTARRYWQLLSSSLVLGPFRLPSLQSEPV